MFGSRVILKIYHQLKSSQILRKSPTASSGGIVLLAVLMLIVFGTIAIFGLTRFVIQREGQSLERRYNISSFNHSQAGIHYSIFNYRNRDLTTQGSFVRGTFSFVTGFSFSVGGNMANFLMVNTNAAAAGGAGNVDLLNLRIQNAQRSNAVVIASMNVTWTGGTNLTIIRINATNVWTGSSASPATCDITDFTLNTTPTEYAVNYLRFSGSMVGQTVTITFNMTDGTSRTVTALPASTSYPFTVKVTGKNARSSSYRTLEADYNALTGRITRMIEINEIIP